MDQSRNIHGACGLPGNKRTKVCPFALLAQSPTLIIWFSCLVLLALAPAFQTSRGCCCTEESDGHELYKNYGTQTYTDLQGDIATF